MRKQIIQYTSPIDALVAVRMEEFFDRWREREAIG